MNVSDQLLRNTRYFDQRLENHGVDKAMSWKAGVQDIRFTAFVRNTGWMHDLTLLDVGCGTGDLLQYLIDQGSRPKKYVGLDPWEKAIAAATARHGTKHQISFGNLSIQQLLEATLDARRSFNLKMEVVACLGVFSHKATSMTETQSLIMNAIEACYLSCTICCAVTITSPYKTEARQDEAILEPEFAWRIGRRLTERVLIDHSYAPHEYMMVLFKEKSPFRKIWEAEGGWEWKERKS